MHKAAIAYGSRELEACERDGLWTVRLADIEKRAGYLDLALVELLGAAPEAHRAAARLLSELTEVAGQPEAVRSQVAPARPRQQRRPARRGVLSRPLLVGLRIVAFAVIVTTAFILTTWLSTLR